MIPRIAAGTLAGVCLQPLYFRYVFVPYAITRYAWYGLVPPLLLALSGALVCELAARAIPTRRRSRPFHQNAVALSLGVSFFTHAWAVKVAWGAHPVGAAALVAATTVGSFVLSGAWLGWQHLERLEPAGPSSAAARRAERSPKRPPVELRRELPRRPGVPARLAV
ncbi:hypothetical protein HN937_06265, partial [Candidatus Poribacteria bacterium]|nr:hypothetical protein [Candidatus Poribacteria bacterium]